MIAVYVETNFVLECAFEQEQSESCRGILDLAAEGRIKLIIPAFSLAEPYDALAKRAKVRKRLSQDIQSQLGDLARSKLLPQSPHVSASITALLVDASEFERRGVRRVLGELLGIAEVIPLSADAVRFAEDLQGRFGLSGQDSIVLSCVLGDLRARRPDASCFLNRNFRDFDDADVRAELMAFRCMFFPNFDRGRGYIEHHASMSDPD